MTWMRILHYWPLMWKIHRSSGDSPHKRPVMWCIDIFLLSNPLDKQSGCREDNALRLMWLHLNEPIDQHTWVNFLIIILKLYTPCFVFVSQMHCKILIVYLWKSNRPLMNCIQFTIIILFGKANPKYLNPKYLRSDLNAYRVTRIS